MRLPWHFRASLRHRVAWIKAIAATPVVVEMRGANEGTTGKPYGYGMLKVDLVMREIGEAQGNTTGGCIEQDTTGWTKIWLEIPKRAYLSGNWTDGESWWN
jgi:hypothetical protein